MKISVIVPTFNEQLNVEAAIRSAQDAGANEIIVVDGGSNDRTLAIALQQGVITLESAPGRAVQQNAAARESSGDVLVFLHADCRLSRNSITAIRTLFDRQPECVGGCFRQMIDDQRFRYRVIEFGNYLRVRILKWIYGDQALFVRRDVFEALSGFPELKFLEDLYFVKRLKLEGTLVVLDEPLSVSARRWQKVGLIRQTARNWAIIVAAHLGASPDWLAKFYPRAR